MAAIRLRNANSIVVLEAHAIDIRIGSPVHVSPSDITFSGTRFLQRLAITPDKLSGKDKIRSQVKTTLKKILLMLKCYMVSPSLCFVPNELTCIERSGFAANHPGKTSEGFQDPGRRRASTDRIRPAMKSALDFRSFSI
jgi:hypothetical protein